MMALLFQSPVSSVLPNQFYVLTWLELSAVFNFLPLEVFSFLWLISFQVSFNLTGCFISLSFADFFTAQSQSRNTMILWGSLLCSLFFSSVYIFFRDDLIQTHGFKYYPYSDYIHYYIFSPESKIYISNCLSFPLRWINVSQSE